jgi:ABC-2 type transport system permease protein
MMNNLPDMIWIELRKAIRARMPLWTALGALFMPIGIAFLIFVSKNPAIFQKLGVVSAKANLVAYAATDWPTYLGFSGQVIAAGEFFLLVMSISWIFGREFVDGTLKDLWAVPVPRASILLAKFIVLVAWAVFLTVVIFSASLGMGAMLRLQGGTLEVIWHGSALIALTACLATAVVMPFALFASVSRGYLLPIGMAILAVMMANLVVVLGWGEIFPWAIPMLYAQGKSALTPVSYWTVLLTGLAGMLTTYLWWMYADQSH